MLVFLFVVGNYIVSCVAGVGCVEVNAPIGVLIAGGFEFLTEIWGVKVYTKKPRDKDEE